MARALAAAAIETAAPPPQTMGGLPTTASGELGAPAPMVRPPAAAARPHAPRSAAGPRWSALALAAVAVVAIVAGVVTIAASGGAGAAAAAPDRSSAPEIEAAPPRIEMACTPEVQPAVCALFMCANEAACVQARCKAPPARCEARRSR
jgi:hypothetical protein